MVIEQEKWIIQAREGFAVGGEIVELFDENNLPIELTNLSARMRILGFNRGEEFTTASGNFVVVPPVLPAIVPTAWNFKLTVADVAKLKVGGNQFEVLIVDQNNVLIGEMVGVIEKRK